MERDYLARQVSVVGDPGVITVATDLPAEATHFVVTAVAGPDALTLTLTGPGTTYFFNYGVNPWIKIALNRTGAAPVTALSLDASGAGNCTLVGFWIGS